MSKVDALTCPRCGSADLKLERAAVNGETADETTVQRCRQCGERFSISAKHAHAVVGRKDGTAHGGQLLKAHIRPTCEVILTESPAYLQKFIDPESGLALIKP